MSCQKCPVCQGVGVVSGGYFTRAGDSDRWMASNSIERCQTCEGTGLIDDRTSLPPAQRLHQQEEVVE